MRTAVMCLSLALTLTAAAENLILNGDFNHNAAGEFFEWNGTSAEVTFLDGQGPEGKNALVVDLGKLVVFRQTEIKLVPGEKYRLGAWIKTRQFNAGRSGIVIYDIPGWYKDAGTERLPADCPEWTLWQAEVTAPPSQQSGLYSFGIFATSATGELQVSDFFLMPVSEKAVAESRPPERRQTAFF